MATTMISSLQLTDQHKSLLTGAIQEERQKRSLIAHTGFGGGQRPILPTDKPTPAAAKFTQLETLWNPVLEQAFAPAKPLVPVAVGPGSANPALVTPAASNKPPTPAPLPTQLGPWIWNPITFNGFETTGQAQLTLYENGGYNFNGSFNDPSAWDYDDSLVWGIVSKSGVLYTFSHSGSMHGWADRWLEGGSATDSWSNTGTNASLKGGWADLCAAWHYQAQAGINFDIGGLESLVQAIIKAVETVVQVIAVVA